MGTVAVSRGVAPTRAGQLLYERGQEILRLAGLAHAVLSMPEPLTQLWRPTIGLLRPLAQLVRHRVRIE